MREEDEEGGKGGRESRSQRQAGSRGVVGGGTGGTDVPPTHHPPPPQPPPTNPTELTNNHPSIHPPTTSIRPTHPSNTPPPSLTLDAFRWSFSASSFGVLSFLLLWGLVLKKHSRQRGLDPRLGKVWGMASGRQLLEAQAGQAEGGGDPPPHPRHRPRRAHSLPRLVFHILPLTTAGPAGG